MPYIGNKSDTAFTSLIKQDLTGASGTSLTLSHAVANANDIALYINNVRQEPISAYSTNGTAVTLTGSVASSDDIYVIYLARAVQTTVPPDGSVSTAKIADSAVSTAKLADNSVTSAKITGVSFGKVLQVKSFQTGNKATGTTRVPLDDSIPQNSEGIEFMTLAITPTSATSILRIEALLICCYSADAVITSMLFQDSTANALACNYNWSGGSGTRNISMYLSHFMTAGTASATTFKIRAGGDNAGTLTMNGRTGARQYGGTLASSITITEIGA